MNITQQQKHKVYNRKDRKQLREEGKKRDYHECQECKRNRRVSIDASEYSESAKRSPSYQGVRTFSCTSLRD